MPPVGATVTMTFGVTMIFLPSLNSRGAGRSPIVAASLGGSISHVKTIHY
jgi:hypothetical protein